MTLTLTDPQRRLMVTLHRVGCASPRTLHRLIYGRTVRGHGGGTVGPMLRALRDEGLVRSDEIGDWLLTGAGLKAIACPHCDGGLVLAGCEDPRTGEVWEEPDDCSRCGGSGVLA